MKLVDHEIRLGSIVELKKKHPCGENRFAITRFGVDCKIQCLSCGRVVSMDRVDLKKAIKKVLEETYDIHPQENH